MAVRRCWALIGVSSGPRNRNALEPTSMVFTPNSEDTAFIMVYTRTHEESPSVVVRNVNPRRVTC